MVVYTVWCMYAYTVPSSILRYMLYAELGTVLLCLGCVLCLGVSDTAMLVSVFVWCVVFGVLEFCVLLCWVLCYMQYHV
nr:NADH dehydrogenase subunit 4L [Artemidia motanka]